MKNHNHFVIKNFVKWMSSHLNDLLKKFGTGKYINLSVTDLHPLTSLEEIAQILNASDVRFDIEFPEGSFYNFNYSKNPEDFNSVVTALLTDKRVEAKVESILVGLPKALRDIKNRLTTSINETEKKELQGVIKEIQEISAQDKQNLIKSQLKGIITTAQLFSKLEEELDTIDRSDMDDSLKLSYYMSIYKTAEALSGFKSLIIELQDELKSNLVKRLNPNVQRFESLLRTAISAKDSIDFSIKKLIKAPLLEKLVESNDYTYEIPLENINKQIRDLERDIENTSSLSEKEKLQKRIGMLSKEKKAILEKAPTKENLMKVFDSQFRDANQFSFIFESKIANGHPVVNTLQNMVNIIYDRAGSDMLNYKNKAQTESDEFSKSTGRGLRDMEKRFEGVADDLVTLPTKLKFKKDDEGELEFDDKGNVQFEYVRQNALIQSVDNAYITKYMELQMVKEHYFDLHLKDLMNNVEDSENTKKYNEAYAKFDEFKKENSQREFSEEYYAFRALYDTMIGNQTVRQITKDAYDEIDRLQDALGRSDSTNRADLIEAIKLAKVELKKLKSEYNDDGSKKDEDGLKLAQVLTQYSKLRYEFGDDILTPEGQAKYNFDLDNLQFKKDQYNNEDYQRLLSKIQQVEISPEYFEALSSITDNINELTNSLSEASQNSEIAQYIDNNQLGEKRKDAYKEIRDRVRPYRDEEQVINGILLSDKNPELVADIKKLQQYVEDLKLQTTKLYSLSPAETNELIELRKNKKRTSDEQQRYQELVEKKNAFGYFLFKLCHNYLRNSNQIIKEL